MPALDKLNERDEPLQRVLMGHLSLLEDHKFLYYFDNFVDHVGVDGHYEHHEHLHGSVRIYEVVNLASELSVLVLIQVKMGL